MSNKVKRHDWNDAAIEAARIGLISKGARDVILVISKAINWKPDRVEHPERRGYPGLYWKNEEACTAVGLGWSTFRRYRGEIEQAGFWYSVNGNLIPCVPEYLNTPEKRSAIGEQLPAQIEQLPAQIEPPFSVDIFTVDTCSVDTCSEDACSEDAHSTAEREKREEREERDREDFNRLFGNLDRVDEVSLADASPTSLPSSPSTNPPPTVNEVVTPADASVTNEIESSAESTFTSDASPAANDGPSEVNTSETEIAHSGHSPAVPNESETEIRYTSSPPSPSDDWNGHNHKPIPGVTQGDCPVCSPPPSEYARRRDEKHQRSMDYYHANRIQLDDGRFYDPQSGSLYSEDDPLTAIGRMDEHEAMRYGL